MLQPSTLFPIPAFSDNYIWAGCIDDQAFVVDPGESEGVEKWLKKNKLTLKNILITHHHYDHTNGVVQLKKHHPNCIVAGPANSPKSELYDVELSDNDSFNFFAGSCRVLHIPGHTLDHICYFFSTTERPIAFCGDTLFSVGCGRVFEGTAKQMYNSLLKLKALPIDTLLYPAHEYTQSNIKFAAAIDPENDDLKHYSKQVMQLRNQKHPSLPVKLEDELLFNPFLRCDSNNLTKQLNITHEQQQDQVAVFSHIRQLKDNF